MKTSLLVVLALAACDGGYRPPPSAPTPEPWVAVASYMNPSLSTDHTEDRIAAMFLVERVEWVAAGSLGYTLSVPASRADRARELLRTVPDLTVLTSSATS